MNAEPYPKMIHGRGGLPAVLVDQMYAEYQSGLSLARVGKNHNRSRQSIFDLFKGRGLKLRTRILQKAVVHHGRKYTPGKGGYLRDTIFGRNRKRSPMETHLHRRIWEEAHGPIPAGHQVMFKDGDKYNVKLSNLECLPVAQVSSRTATGENQFTQSARARLGLLVDRFGTGRSTQAAALKR